MRKFMHPEQRVFKIKTVFKTLMHNRKVLIPVIIVLSLAWLYACPEKTMIPVVGAHVGDWEPEYFWDCPWCTEYDKHKGIDIIKDFNTPVRSSTPGVILYSGWFGKYGRAIIILSPKLRLHLYGHLNSQNTFISPFVFRGSEIGYVGNTGDSDLPHLHYTIVTILPYFWLFEINNMGFLKIFFLNPDTILDKS